MRLPVRLVSRVRSVGWVACGNLLARWPRAIVALVAVTLGVALVAAVTCGYASARQTILDWNYSWVGRSHVHVEPIPGELWSDPRMDQGLAERIARLPNVRSVVTRQKEHLLAFGRSAGQDVVVYGSGIELPGETEVRGAGLRLAPGGRMLQPDRSGEALVEKHLADLLGKQVGDTLELAGLNLELRLLPAAIRRAIIGRSSRHQFRIVGILSRPRFSMVSSQNLFQLRDLVVLSQQDLRRLFGPGRAGLECIDVVLAEPSPAAMDQAAEAIRRVIAESGSPQPAGAVAIEVETAEQRLAQLDRNMRLFRLISRTVSVVALLTAGYIIFTTLGMGMVQRQAELGMLRCLGAGRVQTAASVFAEAVPIAVVGAGLGLAAGVAAAKAVIAYYHVFFTRMVVSWPGLMWAAGGGMAAVMLAVAVPAYLASRVSPLAASRPQTRRIPARWDLALAAVGLGLIGLSFATRSRLVAGQTPDRQAALYLACGVPLLYLGYFLTAPAVAGTVGRVVKYLAAGLLWTRPRLLDDQMRTGRWRTAASFCALMVGISLLVDLRATSESVIRGWELPTRMPPGFLYFFDAVGRDDLRKVAALPEIREPLPLMAFWVRCQDSRMKGDESGEAKFLAGPMDRVGELVQLSFVAVQDGRPDRWAIDAVSRGEGVLVTREFSTRWQVQVGQPVRLWRHDPTRSRTVTVVGVVESPTLDMAIDFMNVRDRFRHLSAGSIIGSVSQANRILHSEYGTSTQVDDDTPLLTRILLFDFPPAPPARPGHDQQALLDRLGRELDGLGLQFYAGSLEQLREMIVGEFRAVAGILQKIALWATAIAALGVGFSMAANVHSRRRQLAVLRAVGATRFQLARLVLAEAVTIALLGSALGIVHGLNLAANALHFDRVLFGLKPDFALPVGVVAAAIGFAVACCLTASLLPALAAARTNILAAMRQV